MNPSLSETFRARMRVLGMTEAELHRSLQCRGVALTQQAINNWLRGRRHMRSNYLPVLLDVLELEIVPRQQRVPLPASDDGHAS